MHHEDKERVKRIEKEAETVSKKPAELNEDELAQVSGGAGNLEHVYSYTCLSEVMVLNGNCMFFEKKSKIEGSPCRDCIYAPD